MTFYNNVTVHAGELFAQIEVCQIEIVEEVLIIADCLIAWCTNWCNKQLLRICELQGTALGTVRDKVWNNKWFLPKRFYNVVQDPPVEREGDWETEWLWEMKNSEINNSEFPFVRVGFDNHFEMCIWQHYMLWWGNLNMRQVFRGQMKCLVVCPVAKMFCE